jgi:hypothetical protein
MTDARLPERWLMDRRVLLTSPGAWRLYTFGLMYSIANRNDGLLLAADLPLIPSVDAGLADELVKVGLWTRHGDGWRITDYLLTQSTKDELDQLERIRANAREKKRRQRLSPGRVPGQSPGTAQEGRQEGRKARPKTEGQGLMAGPDLSAAEAAEQRRERNGATPSQSLRDHDGPEPDGPGVQQIPIEVHHQSQATGRYAREVGSWERRTTP